MLLPMGNLMMMLLHQADQEDENNYSTNVVSCHSVKWKVVEGVSRTGDAHRSTEHISCGEMMQMNNEEHLLITGNYHFPYSCRLI